MAEPSGRSLASSASRFLFKSAGFMPGSRVEISATCLGWNGAIRIAGLVASRFSTAATPASGAAKGMILMVASIWPASTLAKGASEASVIASSTALASWMASVSISASPCCLRIEIGPAGEGGADADMVTAARRLGDARRRLVFGHIAGFEPGDGDFGDARIFQLRNVVVRQHASFAEREPALAHAMGEDRAGCLRHGERPNCMGII